MKLTIKTLKGEKFQLEVDDTRTVDELKGLIEAEKSDLPAAGMKLIHSGKVLKDNESIASYGIKPNDFIVVMINKPKKPVAAPTPTPAAVPTEESKTPAPAAVTAPSPAPPASVARNNEPQEAVESLTAMGFPEAEVRHCLRAADGNPDIAVEFLTNGIPEGVTQASMAASPASSTAAAATSGGQPLQALRNHPQFRQLQTLVQTNPAMLQQVLAQIGQQQPELLAEINANQALFLQMMNEPVVANTTSTSSSSAPSAGSGAAGLGGLDTAAGGMAGPSQMAQMIQSMSAEEVAQMAQMMGISADQLRQTAEVIGSLPPEQLNQYMMQAMGGGGGDDMDDMMMMMGGAAGAGGAGGGTVVHLTEEEMAAVDRLTEMGFDRQEAAQAFLACDKNEALAANLLMDSMGDGGFFSGGGGSSGGGNGGDSNDGNGGGNSGNDDEMYD